VGIPGGLAGATVFGDAAPFDPVTEAIARLATHPSKAISLIRSNKPKG